MKKKLFLAATIFAAGIPSSQAEINTIEAALKHDARPQADVVRDVARRPADILEFLDIRPGMRVVDYIAGRGYYSEIFSHLLNDQGHLYSVRGRKDSRDFSAYSNVTLGQDLELKDVPEQVDRIFTALNYHDIVNNKKLDRQKILGAIKNKLRTGGYFVVIDHNTRTGAGLSDTKSKHRIEAAYVLNEITAAGFKLDSISTVLANPNDNYDLDVWQDTTKGKTDRFV
ncbi:MAG: class I SAM-dependent methyltransferase, partial [Kordiimonas sp.]